MGENGEDNYYYNNYDYNRAHNELDRHVSLAGTALLLGFASIPLSFFLNFGIILGGIAIILAILSKGTLKKFLPQAKKALIYGSIGVVLGYGILAYDVHALFTNPEMLEQMDGISEQLYGISFTDMLKELGVSVTE